MKTARIKARFANSQYSGKLPDGFTLVKSDDGKVTEQRFATREEARKFAAGNGYTLRYSG